MISIDGYEWDIPCDIGRVAEVMPSEISGMLLDKTYFNDVIGTYYSFEVTLAVPPSMADEYATIYEMLTDPVDGHIFIFPYNNTTRQVTARVEEVNDALVYTASNRQYWKGIQFTAVANHPSKTMQLGEVITRGQSPMPEVIDIPIGTMYEMTDDGWVEVTYPDADLMRF